MTDTENNTIDTAEVEQETKDLTGTLYKNVQRAFNNNYALACWSKKNIEAIQKSEEPEDKKALQMTKFMNLNIVISELVLAITDTALFSESLGKKNKVINYKNPSFKFIASRSGVRHRLYSIDLLLSELKLVAVNKTVEDMIEIFNHALKKDTNGYVSKIQVYGDQEYVCLILPSFVG